MLNKTSQEKDGSSAQSYQKTKFGVWAWHAFTDRPDETHTHTLVKISGVRELRHAWEKTAFLRRPRYNWLTTHTNTKDLGTWVSTSVLMNLSPGGGEGVMSQTKSPHWATEPTKGQQINLHYISIPTIHLMRGDYVHLRVCACVHDSSLWHCMTNEMQRFIFADSRQLMKSCTFLTFI